MIRFIYISLFIGLILFKPIVQFGWEIWFQTNQEEIAEAKCENKEEKLLQCHGKCYLSKKLETVETGTTIPAENRAPVRPAIIKDFPFVLSTPQACVCLEKISQRVSNTFYTPVEGENNYHSDIFHPPRRLS